MPFSLRQALFEKSCDFIFSKNMRFFSRLIYIVYGEGGENSFKASAQDDETISIGEKRDIHYVKKTAIFTK
jgi:hypothetical protein